MTPEERKRGRYSPFKDIADSQQSEVANWIKEDAHHHIEGGSIGEAMQHTLGIMHQRAKVGGGFRLSDLHVAKIHSVMKNLAGSARVQLDVASDDFLHRIGLRHERKYKNKKIPDVFREHARLHKDVYKTMGERKGTAEFDYLHEDSTDKYGSYRNKKTGHVVVAFRGTKPKQMLNNSDLVDDFHIMSGRIKDSSSYDSHKQHMLNMIKKHGSGKVSMSSYSLGAGRAEELTQDKDLRSHIGQTISIAGGATATDEKLKQKASDLKISHIFNHSDPVANAKLAHSGVNTHVLYDKANGLSAHMSILDDLAGGK